MIFSAPCIVLKAGERSISIREDVLIRPALVQAALCVAMSPRGSEYRINCSPTSAWRRNVGSG
jgi:hypothetical protein